MDNLRRILFNDYYSFIDEIVQAKYCSPRDRAFYAQLREKYGELAKDGAFNRLFERVISSVHLSSDFSSFSDIHLESTVVRFSRVDSLTKRSYGVIADGIIFYPTYDEEITYQLNTNEPFLSDAHFCSDPLFIAIRNSFKPSSFQGESYRIYQENSSNSRQMYKTPSVGWVMLYSKNPFFHPKEYNGIPELVQRADVAFDVL
jgi:hypothetical protein